MVRMRVKENFYDIRQDEKCDDIMTMIHVQWYVPVRGRLGRNGRDGRGNKGGILQQQKGYAWEILDARICD
jgi:hypothetical protein